MSILKDNELLADSIEVLAETGGYRRDQVVKFLLNDDVMESVVSAMFTAQEITLLRLASKAGLEMEKT